MMLNLPRFLFINGPAGSGKSTLARLLCEQEHYSWRDSFAEPIRDMIRSTFFPNDGPLWQNSPELKDGEVKKQNLLSLAGLNLPETAVGPTVREAMIEWSESYMKRLFGQDIFGRLLWSRCNEQSLFYRHFIIDDSGFAPEAEYVIGKEGPAACTLLRLHRSGHTFAGDSRGYITLPGVKSIDIENNASVPEMLATLQLELGNL